MRQSLVAWIERRAFYGWVIVAVASLGAFASGAGQSHTFSVFVGPIGADLGVTNAAIATAYGLATLAAAFLLPQTGRLVDRFGPRRMLAVIVLLLGMACLLFGAAANLLWLTVGFGLLRFLGQGSLWLGCVNLVSQWFSRKRGLSMGLMALGFGVSMGVHPPLSQYLIDAVGWRQAWVVLGFSTWLLMLPPILLFVHDRPEPLGLRPDGSHREPGDSGSAAAASIGGLTLAEALRGRNFYLLCFGLFGNSMLVTALHFFQVTLLTGQGIAADIAARSFTISALTMVAAMPLVGRLFDRFRTRHVFATGLLLTSASLIAITLASGGVGATLYAVVFGLNNAFNVTMYGYVWPRYFGRAHVGAVQGAGQMVGVVASSIGPLPVGLALDLAGHAGWTLLALAIYPVLAATLAVTLIRTPAAITGEEHLE